MTTHFEAEYTPRHEWVVECQRHAARYVRPVRQRYGIVVALVVAVLAANLGALILGNEAVQSRLAVILGPVPAQALSPALLVVLAAGFIWWLRRHGQRNLHRLREAHPYAPQRFTATGTRLEWQSERSGSWLDYAAIDRLFLTPSALGVMYGGTIVPVPRNGFGGEKEFAAFASFLLARLPEPARRKSLQAKDLARLVTGSAG